MELNTNEAILKIEAVSNLKDLEDLRIYYLGKTGKVSELMKNLGSIPPEEKKEYGAKVNQIKTLITDKISERKEKLELESINSKLAEEEIDITLPGRNTIKGSIHPLSQAMDEITSILSYMGFVRGEGPNIEKDYYNFTALNIPDDHPARSMHDTFYMPDNDGETMVLRTHTSAVQIRKMELGKPPFRLFTMGRTYRSEDDATHSPMFHQLELLWIDKGISMANLKYVAMEFLKAFFERNDLNIRFRPSFFPFTEPSAEVDVEFERNGKKKWLEILGCGMVHKNVLKNVGIDPEIYTGFAFGMGIERLAMLKYGIDDLRGFYSGDLRWLKHYSFDSLDIPNNSYGLTK